MSYRNPQIIVDRSAEIYAKMPGMISQAFAQGISGHLKYVAENRAKQAKSDQGFLKEMNKQEEAIYKQLNTSLDKKSVDDLTFIQQIKGLVAAKLEPSEDNIGILKKKTAVALGTIDNKTRRKYKQDIKDYELWQAKTIDNIGAYEVQGEERKKINASTFATEYDFVGEGNDKFKNYVASSVFADIPTPGITTSRTVDDNNIIISGSIKKNSQEYKDLVNNGLLFPDQEGVEEKDGVVSFAWKRSVNDPVGDLVVKLIPKFDYVKNSELAGLQNERTGVDPNLYSKTIERKVTTKPSGKNKVQDVTRIYIDKNTIENNKVFNDEALAYAKEVAVSTYEQKLNYGKRIGLQGDDLLAFLNDSGLQASIVQRDIIQRNTERLTGSSMLKYDEQEEAYYIEEYSTPYLKPTKVETEVTQREKTALEVIDKIELPTIQRVGPAEEGKQLLDMQALEKAVAPYGFNVKEALDVGGTGGFKLTKNVEGADRTVTIFETMSEKEIKDLMKFIETGQQVQAPILPGMPKP